MKQFYIIAHPDYYENKLGWNLQHGQVKYTKDMLVEFISSKYVPITYTEPYYCGFRDTEEYSERYDELCMNISSKNNSPAPIELEKKELYHQMSMAEFLEDEIWK